MRAPAPSRQRGYTMVEFMIVTVLVALAMSTMTPLFQSTQEMTEQSHVTLRSAAEHRRNLEAIADVLRTVDIATLAGFDRDGMSRSPSFSRVTGVDLEDRTYGGTERLVWRQGRAENGAQAVGDVWLERGTTRQLLATRVPQNGLEVRQQGNNLVVRLSTYYASSARHTSLMTGEIAVSLRN